MRPDSGDATNCHGEIRSLTRRSARSAGAASSSIKVVGGGNQGEGQTWDHADNPPTTMSEEQADIDDDDEEADPYEGKYGFFIEDMMLVGSLTSTVRRLLSRPELTPRQITQLGVFLYAVERLPMVTEGVSMALRLIYRMNQEHTYKQVRIDQDSFQLDAGGYVYDPAVGGDSFGEVVFEASVGEGRDGDPFQAMEFMEAFSGAAADSGYQVVVEDDTDEAFDQWEQDMPADPWEGLESDY